MVTQVLMVGGFVVIALFLWRMVTILTIATNNQVEQATSILLELRGIKAGLFAASKIKGEEGWHDFAETSRIIVRDYINPEAVGEYLE